MLIYIIILGYVVFLLFKSKNTNDRNIIKNGIMNILTFILLFVMYYIVIAIISMIPLAMTSSNSGSDSGLWAISIILGMGLSPILSLITTIRLNKKKKKAETIEQINDNSISQNNKRKPIIIISIIIVSFIGIGIILSAIFNYNTTSTVVLYEIIYYDELTPGSRYYISVQDDNKVEITTTHFCSAINCEPTTEKETFNYSKDNLKKLKTFISDNFSNNYNVVHDNELTDRQKEVVQGLLLGEYFFEINVEEYKYKIEYSKNDSLSYDIYFKNDNSILVKKLKINSDYDIVNVDTYALDFSQKNRNILFDYIEKEVKEENSNIIYKYSTLKKDEINIFNSIVENNESYLNNIENEAKLTYTISYSGIYCPTPTLYLYSDNTYEYYYTFGTDNKKLIPKTGTYNYDITKIINNIDKYGENSFGPYFIKEENGKNYTTYNTNTELQELLKSLDITLEKCLEQQ